MTDETKSSQVQGFVRWAIVADVLLIILTSVLVLLQFFTDWKLRTIEPSIGTLGAPNYKAGKHLRFGKCADSMSTSCKAIVTAACVVVGVQIVAMIQDISALNTKESVKSKAVLGLIAALLVLVLTLFLIFFWMCDDSSKILLKIIMAFTLLISMMSVIFHTQILMSPEDK